MGDIRERKTVMIVEDDDATRDALAALLEDEDYQVLQASNGAEALRILNADSARCGIICLDLMMPVMNGWDFRQQQRRSSTLAHIPVVLMSAGAQLAIASEDLDAAAYVPKPVEIRDLLAIVRRHCGS
ncbi:MAG TPA: response regulator [Polyangia bacterium]|nr:response regulator [Polyangia bacterium]